VKAREETQRNKEMIAIEKEKLKKKDFRRI
jgi:hypothetical protein